MDEEVIVEVGKEQGTNHRVFTLNRGMVSSVESALPTFNKEQIDKASNVFKRVYPNQYDEYIEFLENDNVVDTTDLFESVKPIIGDLPFLEDVFYEL